MQRTRVDADFPLGFLLLMPALEVFVERQNVLSPVVINQIQRLHGRDDVVLFDGSGFANFINCNLGRIV